MLISRILPQMKPARVLVKIYFFFALGLRLVMRPLSVPAPSSMTALMSVGLRERIASSIALAQLGRRRRVHADAAEGLDEFIVARALYEHRRRRVATAGRIRVRRRRYTPLLLKITMHTGRL